MFFMILIMIDSLCIYSAYHLSFWSNFGYDATLQGHYLSLGAIWILLWIVIALLIDTYDTENLRHVDKIIKSTVKSLVVHACLLFVYLFFSAYYYNSLFIVEAYLFTGLLTIATKIALLYSYRYLRNLDHNTIHYIIVGYTPPGRKYILFFKGKPKVRLPFYGSF